ncbi:MAG TPA: hypothetical protein VEU47_00155 [Candidatus Cybelea sp.]|nr:hypothetical protein [Candidatus Cybelea sp.]
MTPCVLVIVDQPEFRDLLAEIVTASGCKCRTADDCATAMREIADDRPNLVLLAGRLNDATCESLCILKRLTAGHYPIPVVVTGVPRRDDAGRRAMVHIVKDAVADAQWQGEAGGEKAHAA